LFMHKNALAVSGDKQFHIFEIMFLAVENTRSDTILEFVSSSSSGNIKYRFNSED
ncbi:2694_t:CDS:2, partial [Dentiscutata heterogama]